ncbi:MAG: hypothetical protein NVS3B25_02690 [Hymenobacter sp.]
MKFLLSFFGVLVAILLLLRFMPTAPINPVLPVGPQKEVNGHDAAVPKGADPDTSKAAKGSGPSTWVVPGGSGSRVG